MSLLNKTEQGVSTKLLSLKGWLWLIILLIVAMLVIPLLNRLLPTDAMFYVPDWVIENLGKYMCFAIMALAIDLIWGYTGILSLGHAFFFALGAYIMGMHMAKYMNDVLNTVPDFMAYMPWQEFPWFWAGFENFSYGLLMALLIPSIIAFVLGYFAFRSRIKGVYFAIITQALTFAMWRLFLVNETGFGGNNGFTNFKGILGYTLTGEAETAKLGLMADVATTKLALYVITAFVLALCFLLCRFIVASKLGRVLRAIRDEEARVAFSGYDTFKYKLFVWTFSAFLCAIAGILFIPQVGIINPTEMNPAKSIEAVIWVAVGGRGTLVGAMIGAGVVNGTKTLFTTGALADYWLFILGGLAVLVPLLFPGGLVDKKSHIAIARGLASMLGIRKINYTFSNLIPVLVLLLYFGLIGLLLTLFIDYENSALYQQISWYAVLALPIYILINALLDIFRQRKFNIIKSSVELTWRILWYFATRQALMVLFYILLLMLAFNLALESSKPFSLLVLLILFVMPIFILLWQALKLSTNKRRALVVVYTFACIVFALQPIWLPLIATYIGLFLVLVIMLVPCLPLFHSLRYKVGVMNTFALIVIIVLYSFLFLFALGYFPIESPISIFMQLIHAFFGFAPQEMLASGFKANMYFILCAVFMVYIGIQSEFTKKHKHKVALSS